MKQIEATTAVFLQELEAVHASLASGAGVPSPADYIERTIAQMRQLLAEMRLVERRCDTILESANDAISVLTPEGILLEANRRWEDILGVARDQLIGRHIQTFAPAGAEEAFVARFREVVSTGATRTEPIRLSRPDGTPVYVEFSTNVITIDGETLVVAVGRDVTTRKRLEAQVIEAQKMEAIGRLTGGIAHDFNNLLAVILGNGELLRDALPTQDPRRTEAVEVVLAAQRAASLTRQLLALSRRQSLEPTELDLNTLVSGLERMLRRIIGEDIELSTILAPRLGPVRADSGQLEQVLMNLAVNARDAMPTGGRLIIETANVWREREQAADGTSPVGPCVMIAVTDTGGGMDEETARRAFEPFFTTKGPNKGTGLGLSTCYGIVKQSGGQISVYSEPGRGSVFKVYLPCCEGEAATPAHDEAASLRPQGNETILLVEDDPQVRAAAKRMLTVAGYGVVEVSSGEEALDVLAADPGPVQLVLTDVVLPGLSGPELVDRLARFWPELPAVCMSGYTDHVLRDQVLKSGVEFIQKPFGPAALARKIRHALEKPTGGMRALSRGHGTSSLRGGQPETAL